MAELRALLSSHGLSADGKKPELVARLQRAASGGGPIPNPNLNPNPSPSSNPSPNPNPSPSPNQAAVLEAQRISELDALLPHLERINQWDVDVFALWEASENMGLVVGTYHLLEQHNLVSKFRLSKPRLMTFLAKMQEGYR